MGTLAKRTVSQSQLLRPYPQYSSVNTNSPAVAQNMGSSSYHSFVLRAEKRFGKGYNLLITYTGSKLIDNGSGRIFNETAFVPPVQNAYNLPAEHSLSEGDVSQRLVISHSLELPFGKGKSLLSNAPLAVNRIVDGWSATGAYTWNTGFPLALTSTGNSGVGSAVLRPNSTGKPAELSGDPQSRLGRWFDISPFTVPKLSTFGNVSRTLGDARGPSRVNYDLALQKSFAVRETVSVVVPTEVFQSDQHALLFYAGRRSRIAHLRRDQLGNRGTPGSIFSQGAFLGFRCARS